MKKTLIKTYINLKSKTSFANRFFGLNKISWSFLWKIEHVQSIGGHPVQTATIILQAKNGKSWSLKQVRRKVDLCNQVLEVLNIIDKGQLIEYFLKLHYSALLHNIVDPHLSHWTQCCYPQNQNIKMYDMVCFKARQ